MSCAEYCPQDRLDSIECMACQRVHEELGELEIDTLNYDSLSDLTLDDDDIPGDMRVSDIARLDAKIKMVENTLGTLQHELATLQTKTNRHRKVIHGKLSSIESRLEDVVGRLQPRVNYTRNRRTATSSTALPINTQRQTKNRINRV